MASTKQTKLPKEDRELARNFAADVLNRVRVYGTKLEAELDRMEAFFEEGTPRDFLDLIRAYARSGNKGAQ